MSVVNKRLCIPKEKRQKKLEEDDFVAMLGAMSSYYNAFNAPIINAIPSVVMRGLVRSDIAPEDFENQEKMNEVVAYMQHYLKDHAENYGIEEAKNYEISLKFNTETNKYSLNLELGEGLDHVVISSNLIKSNEFSRIKTAYPQIRSYLFEEEKKLILDNGTEDIEITSFADLQRIVEDRGKKNVQIQRFKGLGEMMPAQLWETTMDPANRTLLKVNISDAILADELFDILMGDKVEPRRDFIEANAVYATNIDT